MTPIRRPPYSPRLGAQVLCVHYQQIMKEASQVPATVLFGRVQCGKSKAEEAALSMLGVLESNFIRHGSDMKMIELTTQSTLGFVLDDQTKPEYLKEKLLTHFEQRKVVSSLGVLVPKTTFLCSVNMECLKNLAKEKRHVTRAVLIPFDVPEKSLMSAIERRRADRALQVAIKQAPAAAPLIIGLANTMHCYHDELEDIMERVESSLPSESQSLQRIVTSYAWLLFATVKLLEVISKRSQHESRIWVFFQEDLMAKLTCKLMGVEATKEEMEILLSKVVQGLTVSQVLMFIRTDVKLKGASVAQVMCVFPYRLHKQLKEKMIAAPKNICTTIQKVFPKSFEFQTTFLKPGSSLSKVPPGRISKESNYCRCIAIPRGEISNGVLEKLDASGFQHHLNSGNIFSSDEDFVDDLSMKETKQHKHIHTQAQAASTSTSTSKSSTRKHKCLSIQSGTASSKSSAKREAFTSEPTSKSPAKSHFLIPKEPQKQKGSLLT